MWKMPWFAVLLPKNIHENHIIMNHTSSFPLSGSQALTFFRFDIFPHNATLGELKGHFHHLNHIRFARFTYPLIHSLHMRLTYQKVNIRWRAFNFTCSLATSSDCSKWFVIRLVTFHSVYAEVGEVNQLHLKYICVSQFMFSSIHILHEWTLFLRHFLTFTASVDTLFSTIWNNESILRANNWSKVIYATISASRSNIRFCSCYLQNASLVALKCNKSATNQCECENWFASISFVVCYSQSRFVRFIFIFVSLFIKYVTCFYGDVYFEINTC